MSPFIAELVGTMILIALGAGVSAGVALKGSFAESSGWMVITAGWGLGVGMAVYAVGDISGAHLNPAVTLALAFNGDFSWSQVPSYILAQMIGAMAGALLVYLQYLPHWKATPDAATKLGVFSTSPAIKHPVGNMLSEIIGTFIFVMVLLSMGANQFTEGVHPLIVGLLVVSIGLSLGGTTGYAINPARDLGPRLMHTLLPIAGKGPSNWKYAWVPFIGPLLGGSIGGLFYKNVFQGQSTPILWVLLVVTAVCLFVAHRSGRKAQNSVSHKATA